MMLTHSGLHLFGVGGVIPSAPCPVSFEATLDQARILSFTETPVAGPTAVQAIDLAYQPAVGALSLLALFPGHSGDESPVGSQQVGLRG